MAQPEPPPPGYDHLPPAYTSSAGVQTSTAGVGASIEDDSIAPGTLHLAERFVYNANSSDSPPLYELSHSISFLRETDRKVELERLDYSVRRGGASSTSAAGPQVNTRKKHLYNLHHPPEIVSPTFPYYLESASRQTVGNLNIQKTSSSGSSRRRFAVSKLVTSSARDVDFRQTETLFTIQRGQKKSTSYEWSLASTKQMIAVDSEEQGLYRLEIVMAADRMTVDALVAAWCLRIWQDLAESNHHPGGWKNCESFQNCLVKMWSTANDPSTQQLRGSCKHGQGNGMGFHGQSRWPM